MLKSIDRIVIVTDQIEQAQRDCVALLGRSPSWSGEYPGRAIRYVLFCVENTRIELISPIGSVSENSELRNHLDAKGPGLFGLVFSTMDINESLESIQKLGITCGDPLSVLAHDEPSGAYRRLVQSGLSKKDTRGVRLSVSSSSTADELLPPALPLGEVSATVTKVDHVVISTRDADRAKTLYGDSLGIRLALDRSFPERGLRLLFFKLGGVTLEFSVPTRDDAELGSTHENEDNLWGLAYQVPNADHAQARLKESGFDVSDVRKGHKPGTRVFTIKSSPLGIPTLMIEPVESVS